MFDAPVILLLGTLTAEQTAALSQSGCALRHCSNPYDAAAELSRSGPLIRGVCVTTQTLSPALFHLASLLKKIRPDLSLSLAPNSAGRRADLAERAGILRWEQRAPAPREANADRAAQTDAAKIPAASVAPAIEKPGPEKRRMQINPAPPLLDAAPMLAAPRPRPESPTAAPAPSPLVRMAPKPARQNSPSSKADNANLAHPAPPNIEPDPSARYDDAVGSFPLSEDELNALLDDSADEMNPTDPRDT